MNGFYSIWSKPYLDRKNLTEYSMHDFELLTFILSVCMWQKLNGDVLLIADSPALKYLDKLGVLRLFNGGINNLEVEKEINSNIFWAAGKLYALKSLDDIRAMVDLDLIVWKNINDMVRDYDLYVIHREEITEHVYPDFAKFPVKNGYIYDNDWDKSVNPCNTALLYFNDIDFIKDYCEKSIHFMKNCTSSDDNLCPMVFAEQRLISIMAKKHNKNIGSIFPFAGDIGNQDVVTHIWGHKNILKYNFDERRKFCIKILNRLKAENEDVYELCMGFDFVKKYL